MNAYKALLNTKHFQFNFQLNGVSYEFDRQVALDWDGQSTAFVYTKDDEIVVVSQDHSDNPMEVVVAFIPTSLSLSDGEIEDMFMKVFDRDENDTYSYETPEGPKFSIEYCFGVLEVETENLSVAGVSNF